jgi:hypothetical protein
MILIEITMRKPKLKSSYRFSTDKLKRAIADAKYVQHRDRAQFWLSLCRLDMINKHYDGENPEVKAEADKLLQENPELWEQILDVRDW